MKNTVIIYVEAGKRVHAVRIMRGYTKKQLAGLASITPKFLYEIENGKKGFSAQVLYNLCNALEVDCDYIMTGRGKPEETNRLQEA